MSENPSILTDVSLGTLDLDRALAFYGAVLPTLDVRIIEQIEDSAIAFGRAFQEFWVVVPENDSPATVGNGEPYCGRFIEDPDGHKIEAALWNEALAT